MKQAKIMPCGRCSPLGLVWRKWRSAVEWGVKAEQTSTPGTARHATAGSASVHPPAAQSRALPEGWGPEENKGVHGPLKEGLHRSQQRELGVCGWVMEGLGWGQ